MRPRLPMQPLVTRQTLQTSQPQPALRPPAPAERLSKRVAHLRACSRRAAEQLIAGGWVQVNGVVVDEPMARVSDQVITVDANASPMMQSAVTLLLHKPPGIDSMAAPDGMDRNHKPAQQLLQVATHWAQDAAHQRVLKKHFIKLTAGVPLERAASGLVVFTQDWRVLRKLTEDAACIEHELLVEVQGEVNAAALQHLNALAVMERLPPFKTSVNSTADGLTRLRFAIKGAHPGLIAYLCARNQLHIASIKRLRMGRVALSGLPEGQWRYLQDGERF